MTTTSVDTGSETVDFRDPEVRLRALFDPGTLRLLQPRDTSGVLAARGEVDGAPVIAFATDATRMGGAMGTEGCRHIVDAIDAAVRERVPVIGLWHSGGARLAEGVVALDAVGPGVRRDGAGVRAGAADLGGARPGGRRRRVRAGADRHRDHERRRPDLRDRPRGGPQRSPASRSTWPASAARSRTAAGPASCTSPPRTTRRRWTRPARSPRCSAGRAGSPPTTRRPTPTSARCCPSRPTGPTTSSRWSRRCSTSRAWTCTTSGRRTSSRRWAGSPAAPSA